MSYQFLSFESLSFVTGELKNVGSGSMWIFQSNRILSEDSENKERLNFTFRVLTATTAFTCSPSTPGYLVLLSTWWFLLVRIVINRAPWMSPGDWKFHDHIVHRELWGLTICSCKYARYYWCDRVGISQLTNARHAKYNVPPALAITLLYGPFFTRTDIQKILILCTVGHLSPSAFISVDFWDWPLTIR